MQRILSIITITLMLTSPAIAHRKPFSRVSPLSSASAARLRATTTFQCALNPSTLITSLPTSGKYLTPAPRGSNMVYAAFFFELDRQTGLYCVRSGSGERVNPFATPSLITPFELAARLAASP
ncbi:MAG: hypothetical protein H6707_20035 [Deltaproteobacteria bacterium]|nr:hypothetical protein [Deltaproteobacteria bacterium]